MAGRVTLQQVADAAGVSRGTASVILNDRPGARFSPETAARVRAAADALGYRPNRLATALLQGDTQTLALVSADLSTDRFAADLVRGASEGAGRAGQLLFVAQADGLAGPVERLIHRLVDHGVDGFVYAVNSNREVRVPEVLRDQQVVVLNGVPVAGPDGTWPTPPAIAPDDERAGALAGELLRASLGAREPARRRVLLLGRVVRESSADDPLPGIAGALRERGLRADLRAHGVPLAHVACPWWPAEARSALDEYLTRHPAPGAICALNDRAAIGAYDALRRHGLRVPHDVSIVSFDGSELADWTDPPLSSLRLPYLQMGARAVELLLAGAPDGHVEHVALGSPHVGSLTAAEPA